MERQEKLCKNCFQLKHSGLKEGMVKILARGREGDKSSGGRKVTKMERGGFPATETHPPSKFRGDPFCSLSVILLTNQPTIQQTPHPTNRWMAENITYLVEGINKQYVFSLASEHGISRIMPFKVSFSRLPWHQLFPMMDTSLVIVPYFYYCKTFCISLFVL